MPSVRPSAPCRARRLLKCASVAALLLSAGAQAQELLLMGGVQHTNSPGERDDAYAYSYQQSLGENWLASYTYLNEGHVTGHHRDGHGMQLWWRHLAFDRKLALALGAGPYYYFDTTDPGAGGRYDDDHGWAVLASASATWYIHGGPWMIQARYNRVQAWSSFKTDSLMLGIGYQLDRGDRPGPVVPPPGRNDKVTGNELTVMLGPSIVNSFSSEHTLAKAVEYRRGLARYVDGTLTYQDEGESSALRRHGVAAQLWLARALFQDKLALSVGVGPYYAIDAYHPPDGSGETPSRFSAMISMSASYRLGERWLARVTWNRVVTGYDRDSDVFLAGVGYRF